MFSYVDPDIRKSLEKMGRLIHIDINGEAVLADNPNGPVISLLGPIPLPVRLDEGEATFLWYAFVRRVELQQVLQTANAVSRNGEEALRMLLQERMSVNSILMTSDFETLDTPLVRVHSCCMTGDVFGSQRCECGPQLHLASRRIADEGGAVVYMSSHEGRGIGLWAKAVTYLLQDAGQDTYQANVSLGLPEDSRDFSDAAVVLRYFLKGKSIRLLSNNPLKTRQLEASGQKVEKTLRHVTCITRHNERYMDAKRHRGHNIP